MSDPVQYVSFLEVAMSWSPVNWDKRRKMNREDNSPTLYYIYRFYQANIISSVTRPTFDYYLSRSLDVLSLSLSGGTPVRYNSKYRIRRSKWAGPG